MKEQEGREGRRILQGSFNLIRLLRSHLPLARGRLAHTVGFPLGGTLLRGANHPFFNKLKCPTGFPADRALCFAYAVYSSSSSARKPLASASLGMRQSPRGDSATEPTFTPSGRQLRLNCWLKKRR